MKIKNKYKIAQHAKLIKSSFMDFSDEINKNLYTRFMRRLIGIILSKYYYKTAENYIRKNYPKVAKSQEIARLDGGLIGQYQWVRLSEIAKIVEKYNIKSVCEFGSGGSTAMFSQLGLEKFITVEQSEKWMKRTQQSLSEDASGEIIRADRLVEFFDGESCTKYDLPKSFYEQKFDLVYIDGPTAQVLEGDKIDNIKDPCKTMPNIDIEFFLESYTYPKIILIDARRATVRRLCNNYSKKYDIYMRYFHEGVKNRSGNFLYHTVFVKNK